LAGPYHWSLCRPFWMVAGCTVLVPVPICCELEFRHCIAVNVIFLCPLFDKDAGNGLLWRVEICRI